MTKTTQSKKNSDFTVPDLAQATGTDLSGVAEIMLSHVLDNCLSDNYDREQMTDAVIELMTELQPSNALEGLLVANMVSASINAMRMTSQALAGTSQQPCTATMNLAIKLQKVFLDQVQTLQKLRGNHGHQKMTVEHVHVHQGGQAVIGSIENKTLSDGGDEK